MRNKVRKLSRPTQLEDTELRNTDGLSYGPLEDLVGYWIRRLHMQLSSGATELVAQEGLRAHQLTTLSIIVDNPEVSQSDLAKAMGIKPSNIVSLVDELEERGLVVRNAAPNTRRKYAISATNSGRRKRDEALSHMSDQEDAVLNALTNKERDDLINLLRKIRPAII